MDVELTQALRRLARSGEVLTRAWPLRENLTAYDAMYIALAEALDATMSTCDSPLARSPGHRARNEAIEWVTP